MWTYKKGGLTVDAFTVVEGEFLMKTYVDAYVDGIQIPRFFFWWDNRDTHRARIVANEMLQRKLEAMHEVP